MDRKTIVIGLTALTVVSAVWMTRESDSRRIADNEIELYSPELRRHDDADREGRAAPPARVRQVPLASRPAAPAISAERPAPASTPAPNDTSVAITLPDPVPVAGKVDPIRQADPVAQLVPPVAAVSMSASPDPSETNRGEPNAVEPLVAKTLESQRNEGDDVEWNLPTPTEPQQNASALASPPAWSSPIAAASRPTQTEDNSPALVAMANTPAVAWNSQPAGSLAESLWPQAPQRQATPAIDLAAPNAVVPVPATAPLALQPARQTVADLPTADPASPVEPISTESASAGLPFESAAGSGASTLSTAVLQRAAAHLDYGSSLARRGSLFSARTEFQSGLKLIVESLDAQDSQHRHATHFDRALRAIKEAEDFVPRDDHETILLPLAEIARSHQSQLLTAEECQGLTPMKAMQAYYSYASSQLAAACGQVPLASELLHALGKLHALMARDEVSQPSVPRAISLVMYQASLAVDPRNHKSANELGVAYARLGYPQAAKSALLQSLAIAPTVQAWDNLAYVHRQLGEDGMAIKAEREREKLVSSQLPLEESREASPIRWVSPEEFSYPSTSPVDFEAPSATRNSGNSASTSTKGGTVAEPVPAPRKNPLWDQFKGALRAR